MAATKTGAIEPPSLPNIPLTSPENQPLCERGMILAPAFAYEERQKCEELTSFSDGNHVGWLRAMVDRGVTQMGPGFEKLPEFNKGHKVCCRIWIEPAS